MAKNDDGKALHINDDGSHEVIHKGGISLRDYFAGVALSGLLTQAVPGASPNQDLAAAVAYLYADAMLKIREVGR